MPGPAAPPSGGTAWQYYHVSFEWGTLRELFVKNLSGDRLLMEFVCPFLVGEPYPWPNGRFIFNPEAIRTMLIYGTDRLVDSSWPPLEVKERSDSEIEKYLDTNGHLCTREAFSAATVLIESGAFESARRRILSGLAQNFVFVISRIGDAQVDAIYQGVLKPRMVAHGFEVARADEIPHTDLVTNVIVDAIARSRFVVADMTEARPNCYYEVGYAHALGKPCILIARTGTERHFDIAGYRWNYWQPGEDYGPRFESELTGVIDYLERQPPRPRG